MKIITIKLRTIIAAVVAVSLLLTAAVFVLASGEQQREDEVELPILMYHSILKDSARSGKFVITPAELEDDLKWLVVNGYTAVGINDVIAYTEGKGQLPEKPVILSFDDGYYNNYLYAYPLIRQYNMKMVISIVGEYTERYSVSRDENAYYSHITWDEAAEMAASGIVELQNHSYNMHTMSKGRNGAKKKRGESAEHYKAALTDDINKLQQLLTQHTGVSPTCYTYPFGSVSNASFDTIKELGFKASFSCASGINKVTKNPECLFMMKRYLRPHGKHVSKIIE